jgi:hypothetical protein
MFWPLRRKDARVGKVFWSVWNDVLEFVFLLGSAIFSIYFAGTAFFLKKACETPLGLSAPALATSGMEGWGGGRGPGPDHSFKTRPRPATYRCYIDIGMHDRLGSLPVGSTSCHYPCR